MYCLLGKACYCKLMVFMAVVVLNARLIRSYSNNVTFRPYKRLDTQDLEQSCTLFVLYQILITPQCIIICEMCNIASK